jgi:hypothetical protein
MAAPPKKITQAIEEMSTDGLRRVGQASISSDSSGSYRVVPDKRTVEANGGPDVATQWVDSDRGLIVLDLEANDE